MSLLSWPPSIGFILGAKVLIALGTAGLISWELVRRAKVSSMQGDRSSEAGKGVENSRESHSQRPFGYTVLLTLLAFLGYGAHFHFGRLHVGEGSLFLHRWDIMHYYLGAKYFPENGYEGLYLACLQADIEEGRLAPREYGKNRIRRMENYALVHIPEVLGLLPGIRSRFSPERWEEFKADLHAFQETMPRYWYRRALCDHGFNPSPIWVAAGRLVTRFTRADFRTLTALAFVDELLILLMMGFIFRTFGFRSMALCMVFWGVNLPADWDWTGGSLLRQDWLALLGIGICLLKSGRWAAAGACFAYSAGVRGFPLLVMFGPVAVLLSCLLRRFRQEPSKQTFRQDQVRGPVAHGWGRVPFSPGWGSFSGSLRVLTGFLVTSLILVSIATLSAGSTQVWKTWLEKMRLHNRSPSTNLIGMRNLLGFSFVERVQMLHDNSSCDPFWKWKLARKATFTARRSWYTAALFFSFAMTFLCIFGTPLHRSVVWSLPLVFFVFDLSCYYYGFLALLPLGSRKRSDEWTNVGLFLLAMAGNLIGWGYDHYDHRFVMISFVTLLFFAQFFHQAFLSRGWFRLLQKARSPENREVRS